MSEDDGRRKTSRTTAGVPGERFGNLVPSDQRAKMSSKQDSNTTVIEKVIPGGSRAMTSNSVNSNGILKKAEIQNEAEHVIAALEKKFRDKSRQLEMLKKELKDGELKLAQAQQDMDEGKIPDDEVDFRKDIIEKMTAMTTDLRKNVESAEFDLKFEAEDLAAQKKLVLSRADVDKKRVDAETEEEIDKLSEADKRDRVGSWAAKSHQGDPVPIPDPDPFSRPQQTGEANEPSTLDSFVQAFAAMARSLPSSNDKFLARQVQGRDLPPFSGKPEEWPAFYTAYTNSSQNCGYTNADNLSRLQRCLKGDALKLVQCMLITADSVPLAIEKLQKRFGRTELIIQNLIRRVRETASVKPDRLDMMVDFGLAVEDLNSTIISLGCTEHLSNPILLEDLVKKLPPFVQIDWVKYLKLNKKTKDLASFAEWLSSTTEAAYELCPPQVKEENSSRGRNQRKNSDRVMTMSEDRKDSSFKSNKEKGCNCCGKTGHRIYDCRDFLGKDVDGRYQTVRDNRLCFRCLNKGHMSKDCRSKRTCGEDGCKSSHHKLLHHRKQVHTEKKAPESTANSTTEEVKSETENSNCSNEIGTKRGSSRSLSFMMAPVHLKGPGGVVEGFAVFDNYSSLTATDDGTKLKLGIKGAQLPLKVKGFQATTRVPKSECFEMEVISQDKSQSFRLQHVRSVPDLDLPKQTLQLSNVKKWKHLNGINFHTYTNAKPTVLVGVDNAHLFTPLEVRNGPGNAPTAIRTPLGWTLVGKLDGYEKEDFSFRITEEVQDPLHELVKHYFTTESFGVRPNCKTPRSVADQRAQSILDESLKRVKDGWEVGLLWRTNDVSLPESKSNAHRRLLSMERKMDRDANFAQHYQEKIQEYLDKKFARVLSKEEAEIESEKTYYLPHFMHVNPKKPGKMRFVFDAAAKSHGRSLNDHLMQGPDKLVSLPGLLLKFRQGQIGITADIKDMFHRVKVKKEDAVAQRFLWRGMDRKKEPDVLEMSVLIFGGTCSPSCAQEAKNKNAEEFKEEFPKASKAIIQRHYVDDYLDSCDTPESAIKLYKEVKEIHQRGGFNICNWLSSSSQVLEAIPEVDRVKSTLKLDMDRESSIERVLGLFWDPESDCFTFTMNFLKAKEDVLQGVRIPTKRELLSLLMSVYDPLGFLAILTVKAKTIIQTAWRKHLDWDDIIPKSTHENWKLWIEELNKIPTYQLPRCYSKILSTAEEIELHVFSDASQEAFGSVSYFRVKKEGQIEVSFVMSKSNVAPLKELTIPRLELQAAMMGSRLAEFIREQHDIKISRTVFWSDSQTVLWWIKSDGKRYKQFVAARLGEILESSEPYQWRWIPTDQNVADELTRFNKPCDWSSEGRWVKGPSFLYLDEDMWPVDRKTEEMGVEEETLELKKHEVFSINEEFALIDISRFSSWRRMIRATAYFLRFVNFWRKKIIPHKKVLKLSEIQEAENMWIKWSQQEYFQEEVDARAAGKKQPKSSKLNKLKLIDDNGILRVSGRLSNANVPSLVKNPVVLHSKSKYTQLLVDHYHRVCGHHGHERIANEIRQQYHIIGMRVAVRSAYKRCQECDNNRAKPSPPEMGQLPKFRLEAHIPPFTNTGLDYFGPVEVVVKRSREKRYVALFTCLSIRAVHLELVHSLTTDGCIMAIRRFVGRRGCPRTIYSDNGSNFHGANNELKFALSELNQTLLEDECSVRGISWVFNPAAAPHMGGAWERLVKSVKIALGSVLQTKTLHDEVLETLLVEAEHTVNAHPLTNVPDDPDDEEALTPNHFLIGRSSNLQPIGLFQKDDLVSRKQWRITQLMADHFWKRWVHEYIPTLLRRTKWMEPCKPIEVGDVVLEVNENLRRNFWPKGRVEKLFPGQDGTVRVVDIRLANGKIYRRPVVKLCVLDVQKKQEHPTVIKGSSKTA